MVVILGVPSLVPYLPFILEIVKDVMAGVFATAAAAAPVGAPTAIAVAQTVTGTVTTVAAVPLVIGGVVGGVVVIGVSTILYKHLSKPPTNPPQPPPAQSSSEPQMTPQELIDHARERLHMDVVNCYNFAVCGNSGTGKSTFINALRNIDDVDLADTPSFIYHTHGPAPVGVTQTTSTIQSYTWPNGECPYGVLWDLPGGSTQAHPAETYFKDKTLYAFDCILVVKANRFTQLDIDIVDLAQKHATPVVIVIAQADRPIDDRFRDKPSILLQTHCDKTIQQLKNEARQELEQRNPRLTDVPVFVISARKYRLELRDRLRSNEECGSLEMLQLILHLIKATKEKRDPR